MTMHGGLAEPETADTPQWWHNRPPEELQAIVQRGVQGGDLFFAAAREMERRAAEQRRQEDEAQSIEVRRDRYTQWALPAIAVVIVGTLLYLLLT